MYAKLNCGFCFLIIQPQILHIELVKGSGGLGFTLSGGANTVGGCFVRDIVGGPAKEDGRLQQGDQILMVRKLFKCSIEACFCSLLSFFVNCLILILSQLLSLVDMPRKEGAL